MADRRHPTLHGLGRALGALALCSTLACIAVIAGVGASGIPAASPSELTLLPGDSAIWFVGIKNNAVPVPGRLGGLSGAIDIEARSGWVEVSIATLDTQDEERDRNIVTHLFAAAEHPTARFEIESVSGNASLPRAGESVEIEVSGTLLLRGIRSPLQAKARLTREGEARVRVQTREPLVLEKEQLDLVQPFAVLQAVCGHEALSGAVPVQLDLLFGS